jgi:isopenicillin N synthase-like dioxygenase
MSLPSHFIDLLAFETETSGIANQCDIALQERGFIVITNHHTILTKELKELVKIISSFFELPLEEKIKCEGPSGNSYGYYRTGVESLAKTTSKNNEGSFDIKEMFQSGPAVAHNLHPPPSCVDNSLKKAIDWPKIFSFLYQPTPWPLQPIGFVEAWNRYHFLMTMLSSRIMRLFDAALGLDMGYIESKFFSNGNPLNVLRANYYPCANPLDNPPVFKDQIRAGAHTDYGFFTILLLEPGSRGLEVMNDKTGKWEEFSTEHEAGEDALFINIGDLMNLFTSNRWISTLHRVVDPFYAYGNGNEDRYKPTSRVSIAFFPQPDAATLITPLTITEQKMMGKLKKTNQNQLNPIYTGQHIMNKFEAAIL